MEKKTLFYNYLDEQKNMTQAEIDTAIREGRMDEAGFLKAKWNMYDIFKVYFDLSEKSETDPSKKSELFLAKTSDLTANWRKSLESAQKHNDSAKIVVEEQKLSAADAIIDTYKKIMGVNPLLAECSHFALQNKED